MSGPRGRAATFDRRLSCMIQVEGAEYCLDPFGGVADALGKKWTLPLIGVLGNRAASRFYELEAALEGVGAKALSGRLRELESLGLVRREAPGSETARRVYRLTERGQELRLALVPLLRWASEDEATRARPSGRT